MAFECNCIQINLIEGQTVIQDEIFSSGEFNGQQYWQYEYESVILYLFWSVDRWFINDVLGSNVNAFAELQVFGCPFGTFAFQRGFKIDLIIKPCGSCFSVEDRTEREYKSIKLPQIFNEQDRGWKDCCCEPMLVLAGGGNETWKNDVTSAWIKLSDPTDSVSFDLYKDGVLSSYVPSLVPFPRENNAFYTTIRWNDVLNLEGTGCYTLKVSYNISGVIATFTWGSYFLKPYSIENAMRTSRIRVKFNLNQQVEGINFTDANVEDVIRFKGFIGERQPNMEIDNLIYQNRQVKSVVRENLNTYKITTDPSLECVIRKLTDLYLLSENEMWISDYNRNNHSYRYLDLPVIVQESPEINYIDLQQRKAILTCVVGDKIKNYRTYF